MINETYSYVVKKTGESTFGAVCTVESLESGQSFELMLRISDFWDAHLSVGKALTDGEFEELYEKSGVAKALSLAEGIVSRGSISKKALVQKLKRLETDKGHAEKAALIMEERGYIDEDSQAERMALAFCRRKYWGKRRIIAALIEKGYEKASALRAADLVPREEYATALRTVMERKFPDPPVDRKEQDKMIASLTRTGFSLSEIKEYMHSKKL